MSRTFVAATTAVIFSLASYAAGFAYATPSPAVQCARTLALAKQSLLRADIRLLNRCALSLAESRAAFPADRMCKTLRTSGEGVDRHERNARRRIEGRCRRELPDWLPASCRAIGPWQGKAITSPADLAECAVRTTHCSAARTVAADYQDLGALLAAQNPGNLGFEYTGVTGNNFGSCLQDTATVSTTTMPQTTTTTLLQSTTTTTLISPVPPQLVITELMANPAAESDAQGEYFEIWNRSERTVDLQGLHVSDLGSDSFTVDVSLQAAPGAFVVFAKTAAAADGLGDFVYGSAMTLANSADAVVLSLDGTELDRVVYDGGFPLASGASMQLSADKFDSAANDDAANWCASVTMMNDGDLGSPAATNDGCGP